MAHIKTSNSIHFVLGGARSGKSAYAEQLVEMHAKATGTRKIYIATAEAFNAEMQDRIDLHIERRGDSWHTIQEPTNLVQALSQLQSNDVVLIDCLTIWLNNLIHYEQDCMAGISALCDALCESPCPVILVSNEIGLGLVPLDRVSRQFRDFSGKMNQSVAKIADKVTFVAAGLPLILKDEIAS